MTLNALPDTSPPVAALFHTVLVANRGEIARRVIRTLRLLGIRSVAVYSDADAGAPHVRDADVAVRIGDAPASSSYLDADAVIAAARATGAQAIHPGYGFLSENVGFARACAAAGIAFIGPGEQALEVMGDKIRSKAHVAASGVPVVPGFSAEGLTDDEIAAEAARVGYPLLVKPSAGGGGKGMQRVQGPAELTDALAAARRVARAAFGDDTLLLERLIDRPRHIEVQVLADAHGAIIHLGERECTLQRRHQKVVEEAPSPIVDAPTRARLGAAACAAAASVDYRGAGTVEFLVSADRPDEFFFIEMNTRLQVEHPVTELVTGTDLVAEQVRIAAGFPLSFAQEDVRLTGHAIEARVYAESPERGFLPATGDVLLWRAAPGVRTDAAVETGSVVTTDYDPMIAKVIAHGPDRAAALQRLEAALAGTVLLGVDTNITFLRALLADADVQSGRLDTGLIDRMPRPAPAAPPADVVTAAARAAEDALAAGRSAGPGDHESDPAAGSVWRRGDGWRAGAPAVRPAHAFEAADGSLVTAEVHEDVGRMLVTATASDGAVWVHADGAAHRLVPVDRRSAMKRRLAAQDPSATVADPQVRAPLPGAVVAVHVDSGERVTAGARLVTIEAMKMEHPVIAPHDGIVTLRTAAGEQVRRGQTVATVTPAPDSEPHPHTPVPARNAAAAPEEEARHG